MTAQPIAYSRRERPHGQPGEVSFTRARKIREWFQADGDEWSAERYVTYGVTYPAVQEPNDGDLWIWRDSETSAPGWIKANGWINHFTPAPEWTADCPHAHGDVPYRWCTDQTECDRQATADDRQSRGEDR